MITLRLAVPSVLSPEACARWLTIGGVEGVGDALVGGRGLPVDTHTAL
jgi:hypothetical protein